MFPDTPLLRQIFGRPRLLVCAIVGVIAALVLPRAWDWSTRLLVAWNLATWSYLVLAALLMRDADETSIRTHAERVDESRFVVLGLAVLAAIASLAAIVVQLGFAKDAQGLTKVAHLGLAGATIVSAWAFLHTMYAQHYAHEYFVVRGSERDLPEDLQGGLIFPGTTTPTYSDFLYFSFVIGVASQTADVATTAGVMRRTCLAHCIVSFFFNTTILALTINIAAGLI